MLPTPSTSHVSYDSVYEPAEDSYLFLDTLSAAEEKSWLHARFSNDDSLTTTTVTAAKRKRRQIPLLVELGPGSGVIVAFATAHARVLFGTEVASLAVDVNPRACVATRTTVERAVAEQQQQEKAAQILGGQSVYLSSVMGDLTTPLRRNEIDILLFNPPYVPTESVPDLYHKSSQRQAGAADAAAGTNTNTTSSTSPSTVPPTFEESSHLLALSYAGGHDGMETTNRLLEQIPEILSPRGVCYVLFCRSNRPEDVKARIRAWPSPGCGRPAEEGGEGVEGVEKPHQWEWRAETVGTSGKTAGWERLEIVRIWRE